MRLKLFTKQLILKQDKTIKPVVGALRTDGLPLGERLFGHFDPLLRAGIEISSTRKLGWRDAGAE